jgi:hypothetical protein
MHMERGFWKSPVVIEMYGRPGSVIITGTLDAALMLIGAWPTKRTEAHIMAVLACRDVLTGTAEPALARATFIEAAMEAGYRIEPETFLSDRWDITPAPDDAARPATGLAELIRRRAQMTRKADETIVTMSTSSTMPLTAESTEHVSMPLQAEPRLRELFGHLIRLLGRIGREIGRSLGFAMLRRADRQLQ